MALDILNKFSSNLKNALAKAINICWQNKHWQVLPIHLYYGLASQKGSIAAQIIQRTKISLEDLEKFIKDLPPSPITPFPQLSDTAVTLIEKAALAAYKNQHVYIGTEHLLFALLLQPDEHLTKLWLNTKADINLLKSELAAVLKSNNRFADVAAIFNDTEKKQEEMDQPKSNVSALEFFCTDLTNEKIQIKIDPVIGREAEIDRMIHILSRRNKNNPVLIGEAGVGKTAIVEGLAKRVLEKKVPEILLHKKIYRLDLGLVIAGTIYRGEFESRFKQITEELEKNPDILLFIDEIHTLMGAGGGGAGGGAMDAANILKPGLAKGELRCIGATTMQEYQKYIESDAALERRFQPIIVEEPSQEETLQIIKGVKHNYEKYHQVKINDDALEAAVAFSNRYIQDKFLPDKAIDLIDEAAAKVKVNQPLDPLYLDIRNLEARLDEMQKQKTQLVRQEKFEEALKLKQEEKSLQEKLSKLKLKQKNDPIKYQGEITKKDVADIIAKISGIPVGELVAEEKNQLLNLNTILNKTVVGQEEATKAVTDFIRRSRAGLNSPTRPTGSFIFLGPSGVGKTELAKQLAITLFGNEKALVRIDMSEFSEKFNISKLIGAPAGYVGYKEGAKLTDQIKRKPYSVVLFDEIEKAHPDVFNLLLQILEDGHITDATGRKINFKNTIIIMTSNVGLAEFEQQAKIGFAEEKDSQKIKYHEVKDHVLKKLKELLKPELLNRIDKIIVFKPLNVSDLEKIVSLELNKLIQRLTDKKITLKINSELNKYLAEISFTPDQGARAIRKNVQELIESVLAEKILSDTLKPGHHIKIGVKNKQLTFSK